MPKPRYTQNTNQTFYSFSAELLMTIDQTLISTVYNTGSMLNMLTLYQTTIFLDWSKLEVFADDKINAI